MSKVPEQLSYSEDHEWVRVEGEVAAIGITDFAQHELGDIVFVELPEVGRVLKAGETFGVVESVKSVSDLFSPVSGTVLAVNEKLVDAPELVNTDPYQEGWMIRVQMTDSSEIKQLLTAKQYQERVE